ncbi:LicD family protein [Neptunicella marina]|uniref:LicD family protein n=1 Tax=Neptunicella marina TaxID=2125989 RepID=A0A8J6IMS0_9ALTE|nr:LicD family protein [Neptunicella marina]MBC3765025.1 LicD family protein [Neptunicella marina]
MQAKAQSKAIIFGAGNAGVAAKNNLQNRFDVVAFCDNDPVKIGSKLEGVTILSPKELPEQEVDVILIASEFFEKIKQQLLQLGIESVKIQILSAKEIKSLQLGAASKINDLSVNILLMVCKALKQARLRYCADAGTLLGIYRDGALIPWDDDLDVAVCSTQWRQVLQTVTAILPELEVFTNVSWEVQVLHAPQDFCAIKQGDVRSLKLQPVSGNNDLPMMDFFVKYIVGEWMDYTLSSRGIRMPSEHFTQLDNMQFSGTCINIPHNTELYLERHYGDWRTPKQHWDLSELKNATVY